MLDDGLSVTAIDQSASSMQLVHERAGTRPGLTTVQARLETVELPPTDLLYSGLTLPFCHPDHFPALWDGVCGSIRPSGLLAVHLLGDRHGWRREEMTFVTREQVEDLISGLKVLDLREDNEVMPSAAGDRVRMHIFDLVARDPSVAVCPSRCHHIATSSSRIDSCRPDDVQDVRRTTELLRMLVVNPSTVPQGRLV